MELKSSEKIKPAQIHRRKGKLSMTPFEIAKLHYHHKTDNLTGPKAAVRIFYCRTCNVTFELPLYSDLKLAVVGKQD